MHAGGMNFDAKLRRESTSVMDLFYGHISGMDAMARGLRNAARLLEVGRTLPAQTPAQHVPQLLYSAILLCCSFSISSPRGTLLKIFLLSYCVTAVGGRAHGKASISFPMGAGWHPAWHGPGAVQQLHEGHRQEDPRWRGT